MRRDTAGIQAGKHLGNQTIITSRWQLYCRDGCSWLQRQLVLAGHLLQLVYLQHDVAKFRLLDLDPYLYRIRIWIQAAI